MKKEIFLRILVTNRIFSVQMENVKLLFGVFLQSTQLSLLKLLYRVCMKCVSDLLDDGQADIVELRQQDFSVVLRQSTHQFQPLYLPLPVSKERH